MLSTLTRGNALAHALGPRGMFWIGWPDQYPSPCEASLPRANRGRSALRLNFGSLRVVHTALECRNRKTGVLDVAGIRGLSLVSDKYFEKQQPSWADRRQSPIHRSGRLRHKRTQGVQNIGHDHHPSHEYGCTGACGERPTGQPFPRVALASRAIFGFAALRAPSL